MPTLTREQARQLDLAASSECGIPSLLLMENAGRGVADLLLAWQVKGTIVVCCGKGNNGGDGFVVARHLDGYGLDTVTLVFADPARLQGDALQQYQIADRCGLKLITQPTDQQTEHCLLQGSWIVDALLGTGATGAPRGSIAIAINAINAASRPVLAVDLPSGMDANDGTTPGACIRASCTATFVARKVGFENPASSTWTGTVHVLPIGIPSRLLSAIG